MPVDVDDFCWLDQIQPGDRPWVGDKAFHLGMLIQRGYPVIPGFVISSQVLRRFLETIHWLEPLFADLPTSSLHLDVDNPQQLQAIARQIRQALLTTNLWDEWLADVAAKTQPWATSTVILRPSIGVQRGLDPAMPNRLRGLLAAQTCTPHASDLAHGLRRVWAELFRARSLFYWQRSHLQLQQINLAVLVQPLYPAIASGDMHLDSQQITVRSVWGLGMGLARGEVPPDRYQIHLTTGTTQQQQVATKRYAYTLETSASESSAVAEAKVQFSPVETAQQAHPALTASQLTQLVDLARQLLADLGGMLDVEWGWVQRSPEAPASFYIHQLCPVFPVAESTDLVTAVRPEPEPVDPAPTPGTTRPILRGLAAAPGHSLGSVWVADTAADQAMPPGSVLVVPLLLPEQLPWMRQATALVTEQGGMTSHGAILARELGVPGVVGVAQATHHLKTGDVVCVDGDRGVVSFVSEAEVAAYSVTTQQPVTASSERFPQSNATQLMVNLSQLEALNWVANLPVDGVGLLRAEHLIGDRAKLGQSLIALGDQTEWAQRITDCVTQFAKAFAPRPVYYRSLDVRSHEFTPLAGDDAPRLEPNPILGLHGTLSYRIDPRWFDIELAALEQVQAAGYTNVHLILPFVRTVEEFRFCLRRIQQAGLQQSPHFQVWIMAEVPSVLFLLPELVAAGVQGISIGSNDLTQLLLGIDRDQPHLAESYDDAHPAVMRAIHHLIQGAKQTGIPCSICGEAPSHHPEIIADLVRWGITSISVSPSAVERTYRAIARAEQALLLDAVRQVSQPSQPPDLV